MKNLPTYEEFITESINRRSDFDSIDEGAMKAINLLLRNKGIKDFIRNERVADIRKAIEDEGISTKGISDDELLTIAKKLNESDVYSDAVLIRDEGEFKAGMEVEVNAYEYSKSGDDELVTVVGPGGNKLKISRGNLKIQI